ncbi:MULTISPECIES: hypothetical protein [Agrobacterium]|uniref:DUF1206 domain-containing protein n=1 Tax=Agrobacterium larrymoorei TaxID=160699 RepID=A0ABX8TC35_9HYPH|nr:hypothetical protein [Agrobacterium larrymoorei]NSZ10083.1 hypothetical protein [Agrobacterium tumefaciens]QYA10812.1 hypothetical protein J5285_26015 [Agrobacterium larrymoorei]
MPDAKIEQIKEMSRLAAVVLIFVSVAYIALTVILENMGAVSNAQRAFLIEIGTVSQPLAIAVCVAGFIGVLWLAANLRRLIDFVLLSLYRFVNRLI